MSIVFEVLPLRILAHCMYRNKVSACHIVKPNRITVSHNTVGIQVLNVLAVDKERPCCEIYFDSSVADTLSHS